MDKLFIFIGMSVGSYSGWWIGSYQGMMTALLLSGVFSIAGILVGWKVYSRYFG